MIDYKFDTLSYDEFEDFSRDLLREELGFDFRTYKKGKDKGIDISCIIDENRKIIGQVKHYPKSKFSDLKTTLKKEYQKVKDMEMERYILVISLQLGVQDVKEIMEIMNGIIKNENDIYDMKKLNSILQNKKNEWIEKKYYKLWLSSTVVLDRIINNAQENNIEYYVEDIKDKIKLYVKTNNLDNAIKILNENNILLIQGEPGIGKTVLAEMLVYNYLEKGFKLKFVSGNNINELEKIISPDINEKEIIFVDDFLGANYLELISSTSENKLLGFLKRNINKKNKYLVLTTRTTIYNGAMQNFEKFNWFSTKLKKFNLEIKSYDALDKARIFYNHLYFSNIAQEYLQEVVKEKNYLRVINHGNYTPRLMEFITDESRIGNIKPSQYIDFVLSNLNNPKEIWRDEFENKISDEDRFLIWTLFTFNNSIDKRILEKAFYERYNYEIKTNNFKLKQNAFNKSLEVLSKEFLYIKNISIEKTTISFVNPSISDFLINYLNEDSKEKQRILHSFIYLEQLYIFRYITKIYNNFSRINIVRTNKDDDSIIEQRIINNFNEIQAIDLNKYETILNIVIMKSFEKKEIKTICVKLLNYVINDQKIDFDKINIILGLLNNHILSIDDIKNVFDNNIKENKFENYMFNGIARIKPFGDYLEILNESYNLSEYIKNNKGDFINLIDRISRQELTDFASDITFYDECEDFDEDGNVYFDTDIAIDIVEGKVEDILNNFIYQNDLIEEYLKDLIKEEFEYIYKMDYIGEVNEYKLVDAMEEIWEEINKPISNSQKEIESDIYSSNITIIEDMFETLEENIE